MSNTISLIGLQENEFDRIYRDAEFLARLTEQNREMERFVNESLINASGDKRAINEMTILHEAALGDKIKNFFTKIKNFFKKIFDKLGASLNALFLEQKKYIEKYQYIITKCKYQAGDVEDTYDHVTGLNRIVDAVDNAEAAILSTNMDKYCKGNDKGGVVDEKMFLKMDVFNSVESINNFDINSIATIKPEEVRAEAFNQFVSTGYWSNVENFTKENDDNGNADPGKSFKNWFNGSADTLTWDVTTVENNFQSIINTVYAGTAYLNKLEKIVGTVQKKMDEAAKAMEDYYKAQQDKIVTAIKNGGGTPPATDAKSDEAKASEKVADAAAKADEASKAADTSTDTSGAPKPAPTGGKGVPVSASPSGTPDAGAAARKVPVSASANLYNGMAPTLVNEMNIKTGSSSSSSDSTGTGVSPSGAGNTQNKAAADANNAISNKTVNKQGAKDAYVQGVNDDNKGAVQKKAEEILSKDINNRQAEVNADVMISSSIANNMFNSFKLINKDYFSIIQAHVQWYLSNPGSEKATENIVSRPRSLDLNPGGSVAKKPSAAPKPEETAEKPAGETTK